MSPLLVEQERLDKVAQSLRRLADRIEDGDGLEEVAVLAERPVMELGPGDAGWANDGQRHWGAGPVETWTVTLRHLPGILE